MSNATKNSILYVDDDSDDCIFLQASIESSGCKANLVFAADGEEAVAYLNSVSPEALPALIVLDLNMPRWDGRRTLSYLKSQPHLAGIPVVILSTSENTREKQACVEMGAAFYYQKPHRFDGYKGIVDSFSSFIKE